MITVIQVNAENDYMLNVTLSNGKIGAFDVSPYIEKGIFQELKDVNYFKKVRLSFGGVAWPHGQDFSADTIDVELKEKETINFTSIVS